ncbi:FAD-dependent monooxygenase [Actinomadura roseirufa]|uniref:FAD-dependent monooxygenase n=1 Tax=Actinomadura roseirufa TaxID=2094049 RepID=UPI00104134DC
MPHAGDFYFDAVAQVRMDAWSRGRVTLAGDAAHCPSPLSGMGTGLAVVGAYVLAGELAAAGGDHRVAYPRYEEVMRGYAERCQKVGGGVARMLVPQSRFGSAFLDRYYAIMPFLPGKAMMAKMARRTAEAIALPDYAHLFPVER